LVYFEELGELLLTAKVYPPLEEEEGEVAGAEGGLDIYHW